MIPENISTHVKRRFEIHADFEVKVILGIFIVQIVSVQLWL